MPGTAYVEVYGAEMVAEELVSVGNRGADLTPLWPRVIEVLEQLEGEQFRTHGAAGPHGPWPGLSQQWLNEKYARKLSLETLKATEKMFEALTGQTMDSIRRFDMNSLSFGADLPEFAIQQDWHPGNKFPQRLPIDLAPNEINSLTNAISRFIAGRFAGPAGGGVSDTWYNTKARRWQSRSSGKFVKGPA